MKNDRGQRGSIMLIAMLILVVLAGVSVVVLQNVNMEIANAGAFRTAKQGYYLTEAGLTGPIAQAAQNQNVFLGFLQGSGFTVRMGDISPNFFDTANDWGSFGPQFARAGAAQFVTYFSDPVDTQRVPGFSTAGFCYRRYTVTSDGFLGVDQIDADDPETVLHTAQARFVSHLYLGPFQCGF